MEPQSVPFPTIRRITLYSRMIEEFEKAGQAWISTSDLADRFELTSIQVRKDLAFTGIIGTPKRGYPVNELSNAIDEFLGWNNTSDAVIVGAGALGSALMGYSGFSDSGLNIVAAFDSQTGLDGQTIHGKKVYGMAKLESIIKRLYVKIGILTVPADAAQAVADRMIDAGIRAIWNFSPVKLKVPETVVVQREDLSAGLAVLSVKLRSMLHREGQKE